MRWIILQLSFLFVCSVAARRGRRPGSCPAKVNDCAQRCMVIGKRNVRCACYRGFRPTERKSKDCVDWNECAKRNGGCQHICTNIVGSYHCSCRSGFVLASDGKACHQASSRNLCPAGSHQCQHFCNITSTGHVCTCRAGYQLASNNKNCIRLCVNGNGGCHHTCNRGSQKPFCTCKKDHILQPDGRTCSVQMSHAELVIRSPLISVFANQLRELTRPKRTAALSCGVGNGGCNMECDDTPIGVQCSCLAGFILESNRRSCRDIDECAMNNGNCESGCRNSQGSYICTCPRGFNLAPDERSCVDTDECLLNDTCWGDCANTLGSYECTCGEGYQKFAVNRCGDINECTVNNGGCAQDCLNKLGSFECTCNLGYKLHWNKKDCVRASRCLTATREDNVIPAYLSCQRRPGCILKCNSESYFHAQADHRASYKYTCGRIPPIPRRSTRKPKVVRTRQDAIPWQTANLEVNDTLPDCTDLNAYKYHTIFSIKVDHCHLLDVSATSIGPARSIKVKMNWIIITCEPLKRRGKAKITIDTELHFSSSRGCNAKCLRKKLKKFGKRSVNQIKRSIRKELFKLSVFSTQLRIKKKTTVKKKIVPGIRSSTGCLLGSIIVPDERNCRQCKPGSYYNVSSLACNFCPSGTYQDESGQLDCKPCPRSTRARSEGQPAITVSQCPGLCLPGHFSSDGLEPCQPCPRGTYQPESGRIGCYECGNRMITRREGVDSFAECSVRVVCTSGHFYNVRTASCGRCPNGFYQPNIGQDFCFSCPENTTTDYDASENVEECKDHRCGGEIGNLHGVIESPNYPGEYPANAHCQWIIRPPKKRNLLIVIPEIYLPGIDCGDYLIMNKKSSGSGSSLSKATYHSCQTLENPLAFTVGSKKLWIEFRSDDSTGAKGFQIPYVTYDENYEEIIQDIVRDPRLSSPHYHQNILKNKKLRQTLFDVLANPEMYFNLRAQITNELFPLSFVDFLRQKVIKFFTH